MAFLPLLFVPLLAASTPPVAWEPTGLPPLNPDGPTLCPGAYLKPEKGQEILDEVLARYPDRASWEAYAKHIRARVQAGAGLLPLPQRTPLNVIQREQRAMDGYTVENVAFESVPGYFVCGNLYRPLEPTAAAPVVLCTHGHGKRVDKPEDYAQQGRFTPWMQTRCATLARMGAVVLSIEMVGYGESIAQLGQEIHRTPFLVTLHTWNTMRALDFLLSLKGVDATRVAVTGESGGGTQTFLATALDPRVTICSPVVMVSSYFFGGCPCESGLPIHRSKDHFANNVMIAALAAPRPQLLVSDGKDWTQHTPKSEFPFLKRIYGYHGAEKNIENVHLADEGHDYGPSKRAAFYRFFAERFGVGSPGAAVEKPVTVESYETMRVFTEMDPLPRRAHRTLPAVERTLRALQGG